MAAPTQRRRRRPTCRDMAEVRAAIDAIDARLVPLLCDRLHFIAEAARIKQRRGEVRDPARIRQVLAKTAAAAAESGGDVEFVTTLYRHLIEASIAHELRLFDARRKAGAKR